MFAYTIFDIKLLWKLWIPMVESFYNFPQGKPDKVNFCYNQKNEEITLLPQEYLRKLWAWELIN